MRYPISVSSSFESPLHLHPDLFHFCPRGGEPSKSDGKTPGSCGQEGKQANSDLLAENIGDRHFHLVNHVHSAAINLLSCKWETFAGTLAGTFVRSTARSETQLPPLRPNMPCDGRGTESLEFVAPFG